MDVLDLSGKVEFSYEQVRETGRSKVGALCWVVLSKAFVLAYVVHAPILRGSFTVDRTLTNTSMIHFAPPTLSEDLI